MLNKVYKETPSNRDLIAELFSKAKFIDGEKLNHFDYIDHSKKADLRRSNSKDHCSSAA